MPTALIDVVMPAHQAAPFVAEAIASLRAQTQEGVRIVVVDDGSTDGTAEAAAAAARGPGAPVRILRQDNRGAGAARDAGIAAGTAPFVLLADADDRADPGLCAHLLEVIERTGADLAFARCRYVDVAGRTVAIQAPVPPAPGPVAVLDGFMVNTPLVRRAALAAIGGHDRALEGSIDLDLRLRLAMRRPGALAASDVVLSDYRRSAGQITSDWRRMEASWTRVRDKAVAAGLSLTPRERRRMRGRHCVYWATLAYMAGEHGAARRLMVEAFALAPGHVVGDAEARVRGAAALASLLPRRLHDAIRARFNGRAGEGRP